MASIAAAAKKRSASGGASRRSLDRTPRGGGSRLSGGGELCAIALGGETVAYRLVRSRRQTIEIGIDFSGLAVRAPRLTARREIEELLRERAHWIRGTIREWESRRRDVLPDPWVDGATIVVRGRELRLALRRAPEPATAVDLQHFTVDHPTPDDPEAVARYALGWLRREALAQIGPRAAHYAAQCRARISRLVISNARSEWGSCNQKGEVRLGWRLVHLPPPLADYVVAHEIAHLLHLDHSPRFWALVERLYPGHAAARTELDDWLAVLDA